MAARPWHKTLAEHQATCYHCTRGWRCLRAAKRWPNEYHYVPGPRPPRRGPRPRGVAMPHSFAGNPVRYLCARHWPAKTLFHPLPGMGSCDTCGAKVAVAVIRAQAVQAPAGVAEAV